MQPVDPSSLLPSPTAAEEEVVQARDQAERRRRGSTFNLASASYLASAFAIVTGPLMARALGPTGRGEVAAAMVYAAIFTIVAGLGLPWAVGYLAATRAYSANAVLATATRFVGWSTIPMLAVSAAIVVGPLSELSRGARLWAMVLLATVPIGVLGNCLNSMLVAEGALGPLATLRIMPVLLSTIATVALYVANRLTVSLALFIAVATTVGISVASWRMVGLRPRGRVPVKEVFGFGLRGYIGHLAVFATHMVDQAVILAVLGPRPLGFYAVAVTISSVPNSIIVAVYSRYFAPVAEESDTERRGTLISRALRLTLVGSVAVAGGIAACSPVVLPLLYGRPFGESVLPLLLLLPGSVIFCVSMVGESFLAAIGRPGRVTLAELTGFGLTLIGLPLVVPRWGIVGAAVLSSASYAVVLLTCLLFLRKVARVSLRVRKRDLAEMVAMVLSGISSLRSLVTRAPSLR